MMNEDRVLCRIKWGNVLFPLLILILYGWVAHLPDLRLAVPEWIGASAGIVVLICLAYFSGCRDKDSGWSAAFIIFLGAVFRGLFLMRPPELSDDIFRYVFDGRMLLSGHNPYLAAPLETLASHPSLAELAMQVNHGDLPTIYPPAAQFIFAIGAFWGGVPGMKLFLVVLDIFTCLLMARILKTLRLPVAGLILYAWHPLVVLEIGGNGHIDAAVVFFMFLALNFLITGISRPVLSGWGAGIFFAASILTKWLPLIFLPGFALMTSSGNRKHVIFAFWGGGLALMGIFWPAVQNGFHSLLVYAANWEFSGILFRLLRSYSGSGGLARLMLAAIFTAVAGILYFRCFRAMGGFPGMGAAGGPLRIFRAFYGIAMAFLILTPTLHPWYALYLVAFLPFAGGAAGMVLSWSVLLPYRVVIAYALTGQWVESDLISAFIVAGPLAAGMATVFFRKSVISPSCSTPRCRLQN